MPSAATGFRGTTLPGLHDDQTITARDILARTVLYKVGHHGSHNATLAGKPDDEYPNLSWMGRDAFAGEFTAMITAVTEWALTKNNPPWRHPLPSIKEALEQKAQGRVFQTDAGRARPARDRAGCRVERVHSPRHGGRALF